MKKINSHKATKLTALLFLVSCVFNLMSLPAYSLTFGASDIGKLTGVSISGKTHAAMLNHCNGNTSGAPGSEWPDDATSKGNFLSYMRSYQTNGYGTTHNFGRCTGAGGDNVTRNLIGSHFVMSIITNSVPNANFVTWLKNGACNGGFTSGGSDDIGDKCNNGKSTITLNNNVWDDDLYNRFTKFIYRDDITIVKKSFNFIRNSGNAANNSDGTNMIDASSYEAASTADAIVIQLRGVDIVAMKLSCGNLVQPEIPLSIELTSSVNKTSAYVGENATWTYSAKVKSGVTYSKNINLQYDDFVNTTTSRGTTDTAITPYSGLDDTVSATRTITFSSPGTYCSNAYLGWGGSGSTWLIEDNQTIKKKTATSNKPCVSVSAVTGSNQYIVDAYMVADKESATIGESTTFTLKAIVTQGPTPNNLSLSVPTTAGTDDGNTNAIIAKWLSYKDGSSFSIPNNRNSTYAYGYFNIKRNDSIVGNSKLTGYFMPTIIDSKETNSNPPTFIINPAIPGNYCLKGRIKNGSGQRLADGKLDTTKTQTDVDSDLACVNYSYRPRVQIWGGDLSVGKGLENNVNSDINTGLSVKSSISAVYGSWAEYGIFSTGASSYMASATKLNPYISGLSISCSQINLLTFSNSVNCGGNYKFKTNMRNYANYFTGNTNITTNPLTSLNSDISSKTNTDTNNTYNYSGSDTLTLSISNQLPNGRSSIIKAPNATVYINKDIVYPSGNLTSLNEIPQLVIIAKNIVIDSTVTNVNAWLIAAEGYINTCGSPSDDPNAKTLSTTICNNQLTINGPVVANRLYLFRTYDDIKTTNSAGPSEYIKLSADAYLWLYNRSLQSKNYHNTYSRELPPRL